MNPDANTHETNHILNAPRQPAPTGITALGRAVLATTAILVALAGLIVAAAAIPAVTILLGFALVAAIVGVLVALPFVVVTGMVGER